MNVVNPGVLAELDLSMLLMVLVSLLGAAIVLLLACVIARAGADPAVVHTLVPVTVGRTLPGVVLPPRALSRAGGASRAPPCPSPVLRAGILHVRNR
jgi:hypothetical protein